MPDLKRIMIVPKGEWNGHPAGPATYGDKELTDMVSYFNVVRERSGGEPVLIDYEHQSLNPKHVGLIPAAGWIHSLELDLNSDDPGVYGMVEWTDAAAEAIRKKELRSLSPVIVTGEVDPVTGEAVPIQLWNAGATNQPFMADKMLPLAASAMEGRTFHLNSRSLNFSNNQGGASMDIAQKFTELKAALGLLETAGPDEVIGLVKKMAELMAAMPGAPGEGVPSPEQMGGMESEMKQQMMNSKLLLDIAKELDVTPDKVLPTVAAFKVRATSQTDAEKEIADLKAFKAEAEIRNLIEDKADFIPPAKRDEVSAFAKKHGLDAAKEFVNTAFTTKLPTQTAKSPEPPKSTDKPSPEFVKFRKAKGRTDEQIQTEWAFVNKQTQEA